MDGFFILIVVLVIVSLVARALWWVFAIRSVINYTRQLEQQQKAFLRMLQQAQLGGSTGGGIDPQLLQQWGQMQQTYASMNASDQMHYSESMASMKAEAASMGCFLD